MVLIPRMIARTSEMALAHAALKRSRVVALLGPRQSGKTTLARQFVAADSLNYFDLEDPQSLARLAVPDTSLRPLKRLIVIDEIQRRPDLFPLLRVLADRKPLPARFLILGSASPELLKQSSESLAGRLETIPLEGFRLADLGAKAQAKHWLRGGFPLSSSPPGRKRIRPPGGGSFCRPSSSATSRNWASPFQRSRCGDSGTWSRITTGRFGTPPNSPAPSPSTNPPCAVIST